ncbi:MAG: hypothetical protein HKN15_13430 [Xanthomonadales bacterium]|nr:hypothetical protein [Xanthomonadales bacterium]
MLFTFGVSDDGKSNIRPDAQGNMQFYAEGACNVLGSIDLGSARPIPHVLYGPNAAQPPLRLPAKPQLVFNQIAEADSHRTALERCVTLCKQLDVPVINDPGRVLKTTRDSVSGLLQGIDGLQVPKVLRCAPVSPGDVFRIAAEQELPFPFLVRSVGEHNGRNMVLVKSGQDHDRLHRFPYDGSELYLVEFIDFADANGHYHKHRIAMVDGKPYLRHSLYDKTWMVHADSLQYMKEHDPEGDQLGQLHHVEQEVLPELEPVIAEIDRRLGLDHYGLDFGIGPDKRMILFEANANMNILAIGLKALVPRVRKVSAAISAMIQARLRGDGMRRY